MATAVFERMIYKTSIVFALLSGMTSESRTQRRSTRPGVSMILRFTRHECTACSPESPWRRVHVTRPSHREV